MDSTGASSSPFDSFKSKKLLRSSIKKQHSADEALGAPDQSPWSSKTPEKPAHPPRRSVTRRQALRSVSQVREAAKQLRKSDSKPSVSSDPFASSATLTETSITKPKTAIALPERYEVLDIFFNSMQSSIRILRLKGSMTTFTNISRAVESLTDRRFTYSHLAQLKFILREGIEIKKILLRDDHTSCMKPDLDVTLNFSIIQKDKKLKSENEYIQLRKLFRSRLVSYYKSNPEVDEVPEEMLPEPFNLSRSSHAIQKPNFRSDHDTVVCQLAATHVPQSFKRSFSEHKVACSPIKLCSKLPETPISKKGDVSSIDGTPSKLISTPISATPAQAEAAGRRRVRGFMTPDEDEDSLGKSKSAPSKLTRRSSRRRLIDDDDILSGDLFASIKENERKAKEKNDPAISQAKWRKQMIGGLPKLFDSLLFIFQNRSVITKEELIHTIISCRVEIVDRREVDEQLRLLQELAPEYIHEKLASSGDLLICVNKISSPESIRTRLSEAS